jgi:hypothetical protein
MWNYVLSTKASKMKRSSTMYIMLDPHPAPIHLSHMEFSKYFMNVTIVNHVQANQMLSISSIKIDKGCFIKFEHLTLCHDNIDVANGGCACLQKCIVGASAPSLDIPTTTLTHDWQNDMGKNTFQKCILSPTMNKTWKLSLGRKQNDRQTILIDDILTPSQMGRATVSTAQQQQTVVRRVKTAHNSSFDDDALDDKFLAYLTGHTPPTTTVSSARQKVISVSSLGLLNQVTCPMHIDSSPKFKVSKQFNPTTTINIKLKVIFMHGYYWGDLTIKADPSYTVAQVKTIIVSCWYDFGLEI